MAATRGVGGAAGAALARPAEPSSIAAQRPPQLSTAIPRPQALAHLAAAPLGHHSHRVHRALLPPCRITNTSEEVYRAMGKKAPDGGPEEELMLSDIQVHNPELGILENRVGKFYLQELFEDSGVDLEETAYWFHTPPGGWNTKPVKMVPAEEAPVTFADPLHEDAAATNRVPLSELQEGMEVTGVITDCWLYHGIQVDFGAECDGLVPIYEESWRENGVRETLLPGVQVRARIYKLRCPGLFRWPVQLVLVDPSWINNVLPPPEAYQAPINHEWCDDQSWTIEQICEATGRNFAPNVLLMPSDHATEMIDIEQMFGYDDPDSNVHYQAPVQDFLEEQGEDMIMDLVSRMQAGPGR